MIFAFLRQIAQRHRGSIGLGQFVSENKAVIALGAAGLVGSAVGLLVAGGGSGAWEIVGNRGGPSEHVGRRLMKYIEMASEDPQQNMICTTMIQLVAAFCLKRVKQDATNATHNR